MELDELTAESVAPTVAVAAAMAALFAPPARRGLRRAAVYGLAGLLTVGSGVAAFFRAGDAHDRAADAAFVQELAEEARAERSRERQPR